MVVNELARKVGIRPHVVRYYARIGLLKPTRHPGNDYQLFNHRDLDRLRFIRKAQRVGLTLNDITELLDHPTADPCCRRLQALVQRRMDQNRRRIEELQRLQHRMETLTGSWGICESCLGDCDPYCSRVQDRLDRAGACDPRAPCP
ncbi:MAG TPA: MerR family transcriptional regulator [Gammaproteobacteria bacterium]|nr:MerR family transcriptional regulator [Gammaproteobacteria bacterium]